MYTKYFVEHHRQTSTDREKDKLNARLAQLVRAPRLHRGGRGFESLSAYQPKNPALQGFLVVSVKMAESTNRERERPWCVEINEPNEAQMGPFVFLR
jgi:hypothetical protein